MTRIPSRRGRNGHTANCPYPNRPARNCTVCAGELLGRPDPVDAPSPAEVPLVDAFGYASVASTVTVEQLAGQARMTACLTCFAPTLDDGTPHQCRTYPDQTSPKEA